MPTRSTTADTSEVSISHRDAIAAEPPPTSQPPMTSLIVEDDATLRDLICTVLEGRGHQVTAVASGEEAWQVLQAQSFSLVLLDWALPGIDGLELCRRFRRLTRGRSAVVLFITGRTNPTDLATALQVGANDFLTKPFELSTFEIRLRVAEQRIVHQRDLARAEEALRLHEQSVAAATLGIIVTDARLPQHPIVTVNRAFERLTGYTPAETLGRNCRFLQGVDTDPKVVSMIREALFNEQEITATLLNYRRDGSPFWNELHISPIHDDHGTLTHFVGVQDDISERVWANQELRFRASLLDQVPVAVIASTLDGIVTHWNREASALYGWAENEAIGRNLRTLMVKQTDPESAEAIFTQLLGGETWRGDFDAVRLDGSTVSVRASNTAMYAGDGEIVGLVSVSSDNEERKAFETQLTHQAMHDALTGLPNRHLLIDRLRGALARSSRHKRVAVFFLDIDRFKLVNDTLGHSAGDDLLVTVSRRLETAVPTTATVARFGGDEFVLVVEQMTAARASRVAEQVLTVLREAMPEYRRSSGVSVSIGIALAGAADDSDDVIRDAALALTRAKKAPRGRYALFNASDHEHARSRYTLEQDLVRAMDHDELVLHYQPVVQMDSGVVIGLEALVRWNHPEQGLIPPNTFIPIAEEAGLIVPLGQWVLDAASRQAREWRNDPALANLSIAVNIAAAQVLGEDLVGVVQKVLDNVGLEPGALILEVTETTFLEDSDRVRSVLRELKHLGARVAIDDFGTGYSSLAYLRHFPADVIKLDQGFVRDVQSHTKDRAILQAVVQLAAALELQVIAEGIETDAQLAHVRAAGVEYGQGFLFARPMPADVATAALARGNLGKQPDPSPSESIPLVALSPVGQRVSSS